MRRTCGQGVVTLVAAVAIATPCVAQQISFVDATARAGLGEITAARLCCADLNGDGRADVVVRAIETKDGKAAPDRYRVFLNTPLVGDGASGAGAGGVGFSFVELAAESGLPVPQGGDCLVFADIDNDGHADAVLTRNIDASNAGFRMPENPARTAWLKGNGDGTFGAARVIEEAPPKTTACIAVGDIDRDGWLDLYLGNWYSAYGSSNEAFTNDLLFQQPRGDGEVRFHRQGLPEDGAVFSEDVDGAGRPTYGAMVTPFLFGVGATRERVDTRMRGILELNYGRRANRLWGGELRDRPPPPPPAEGPVALEWACADEAVRLGLDGDGDRSGKYPEWLKERGKVDARFDRADEKAYRSHGNTFDATIGDVDGDGDFDLFVTEIRHGWAGDSSDTSRFLVNGAAASDDPARVGAFASPARLGVDRIPADPSVRNWNMGDLFAEMMDFDQDGRLDLLLSSGDYPDNQRLRVYRQQPGGRFVDVTAWSGLNNEGSQQISLADLDHDGDMDVVVGQSFNRLDAAQREGRAPSVKAYLNQTVEKRRQRMGQGTAGGVGGGVAGNSVVLELRGDPSLGVARDALGAVVTAMVDVDGDAGTPPVKIVRYLAGIGGHAGKQSEFVVHIPLGEAASAEDVVVRWNGARADDTRLGRVKAGRHRVSVGEARGGGR